nr:hypothetical protein [Tanacetum cinerariifolium]
MKLSEVKKFSDGTLVKIQKNLIDMLSKNKLGSGNKRLKGKDWTDYDVKSSREMLKKIDEILRHKEQLRRLEEYVGGRPKIVNPRGSGVGGVTTPHVCVGQRRWARRQATNARVGLEEEEEANRVFTLVVLVVLIFCGFCALWRRKCAAKASQRCEA